MDRKVRHQSKRIRNGDGAATRHVIMTFRDIHDIQLLNGRLILVAQKGKRGPKSDSECRADLRRINADNCKLAIAYAKLFLDLCQVP